jgi:hypothetical protein
MRFLLMLMMLMVMVPTAQSDSIAPGGNYELRIVSEEVKMSHWLELPSLIRIWDRTQLWAAEFPWSLSSHHWLSSEELELELRRYPGDRPLLRVQMQLDLQTFRFWEASRLCWSDSSWPLIDLNGFLEQRYSQGI